MHLINLLDPLQQRLSFRVPRYFEYLARYLNRPLSSLIILMLAGTAVATGLPPWHIIPLVPLGLVILFAACLITCSWKLLIAQAFMFGMGYYCFGLYWVTYAILTRIAEFWWLVPFAVPGISLLVAPLFIIPVAGTRLLLNLLTHNTLGNRSSSVLLAATISIFAGLYLLSDQARMYIFTGFPWNPIGSIWELQSSVGDFCIQPAAYIGIDGISLFTVLVSLGILFKGYSRCLSIILVALYGVLAWWHITYPNFKPVPNKLLPHIGIMQSDIPEDEVLDESGIGRLFKGNLITTHALAQQMQNHNTHDGRTQIIIWPESGVRFPLQEVPVAQKLISEAAEGAWVITGTDRSGENDSWYNTIEAVSPSGDTSLFYDKVRLVPFGEYQPGFIPLNLVPGEFTPGSGHKIWDTTGLGRPSPLVCYETIFSGDVKPGQDRPGWLLSVSNDAWYAHSAGPQQHLQSIRMRSVEEGIPSVFVNNAGPSGAYDALGRVLVNIPSKVTQSAEVDIPKPLVTTLFSIWGRTIPTCLSLLSILLGSVVFCTVGRLKKEPI